MTIQSPLSGCKRKEGSSLRTWIRIRISRITGYVYPGDIPVVAAFELGTFSYNVLRIALSAFFLAYTDQFKQPQSALYGGNDPICVLMTVRNINS